MQNRFFVGDEQGHLKSLRVSSSEHDLKTLHTFPSAIQNISTTRSSHIATCHADGSLSAHKISSEGSLETLREWTEPRLSKGQRFVGLHANDLGVYSCTSNGSLRYAPFDAALDSKTTNLPIRLQAWRMNHSQFAYGGDEVELSIWDTEKAFAEGSSKSGTVDAPGLKRKRGTELLPAEIWRAKNLPNDHLNLRQPVNITSLAFIGSSSEGARHIAVGTQNGHVRKYDTRAARRPVADWKNIAKVGGIRLVEKGNHEHELFVSDHGPNLLSVDMRNGSVLYAYHGPAGSVNCVSQSPELLISTSLDRYARVHSTFSPPTEAGKRMDRKGEVVQKVYMTTTPTVVAWDQSDLIEETLRQGDVGEEDDDVWDIIPVLDEDSESEGKKRKKKSRD